MSQTAENWLRAQSRVLSRHHAAETHYIEPDTPPDLATVMVVQSEYAVRCSCGVLCDPGLGENMWFGFARHQAAELAKAYSRAEADLHLPPPVLWAKDLPCNNDRVETYQVAGQSVTVRRSHEVEARFSVSDPVDPTAPAFVCRICDQTFDLAYRPVPRPEDS